jgi:glycosyltransferase involved in cell wall biosynthesis
MVPRLTISVALATFNSEKFLSEQLTSLLRQKRLPDELVVGDDGSTDRTITILQEFSARAPFPVSVHRNPVRLGYTDNFLSAASRCSGDLIAFCDHDDIWHEDKLARCEREFGRPDVKLVVHDTAEVDGELELIGYSPGIRRSFVIPSNTDDTRLPWIAGCAEVVRKEVVEEILRRWPPHHTQRAKDFGGQLLSHDQIAFFVANALGSIHYIAEALILHRFHGKNVTASRPTIGRKVRFSATVGRDEYRSQATLFRVQALILTQMAQQGGNTIVTEALYRKARAFMRVALAAKVRSRIYNESNKLKRVLLITKARGRGIYAPDLGIHSYRSVIKDMAAALLLTRGRLAADPNPR